MKWYSRQRLKYYSNYGFDVQYWYCLTGLSEFCSTPMALSIYHYASFCQGYHNPTVPLCGLPWFSPWATGVSIYWRILLQDALSCHGDTNGRPWIPHWACCILGAYDVMQTELHNFRITITNAVLETIAVLLDIHGICVSHIIWLVDPFNILNITKWNSVLKWG